MRVFVAILFLSALLQYSNAGLFSKSKKVMIGPDWTNPQVTVAKYTNPKKPEYVILPATTTSINNNNNWTKTDDSSSNLDVDLYCENLDDTICALYEKGRGKLVGMQFGIEEPVMPLDPTPKRQNKKEKYINPYTLEVIKAGFQWSTSQFNGGNNLLVLDVIFPNNPQLLKNLRAKSYHQLSPDKITVVGKQTRQISIKEKDLVVPNWYKQNCAKERGTHYGFGLSKEDHCLEYFPVMPLVKEKQLIGLLFMVPGIHTSRSNWFQKLDDDYIEKYFPKTSKCFQKSAPFSAVHVSFVDLKNIAKCESYDNIKSGLLSRIRSIFG